MTHRFDEKKWPELTRFRDACLVEDYAEMKRIAAKNHHWYANENPENLPMEQLAVIYQAQVYAAEGNLDALTSVIESHPWRINHPWTAQGWLPISQAASLHGDRAPASRKNLIGY
jgi:hypothetical protein